MGYSIDYIYRISDRFSSVMERMRTSATRFDTGVTRMQTGLRNLQGRFQATGAKLANLQTGLAALGAGAFLKSALDEAIKFGDGIARIGTLIPGQKERLTSLKMTISDLAVSMGKDVNDIAGGAFDVISAFGDMEGETEKRLKAVAQAAVAGGATTSEALSLLSAVTKSYGDTSGEALQKASDLAFMTNVLGQTTFPEMAAAMGKVLPLTAQLGVSQEEVFASMATLTGVTGNTAEVSTQLSAVMSALIKPTAIMDDTLKRLGYSSASAMLKEKGLAGSLGILAKVTNGSEKAVGQLFGSKEAMTAFFALSGAQADKFKESLIAMSDAAASKGKVTQDALNEMMDAPGYKLSIMTSKFQKLKIMMGDIIAQSITPLIERFGSFMGKLIQTNPEIIKMATYFLMGITAIGAILIPLGLIISTIGTLIGVIAPLLGLLKLWTLGQLTLNAVMSANPIGLVIIGIAALIAITIIVIKYWDQIVAALKSAWKWMVDVYDAVKGLAFIYGGPLGMALIFIIETIRSVINNFAEIKAAFTDQGFYAGITSLSKAIFIGLIEPFTAVYDLIMNIKDKIVGVVSGVKDFFTGAGSEASSPYASRQTSAPVSGRSRGMESTANASVSVYAAKGLEVKPFEASGDLGYNMTGTSRRR